ncbi:UPF0187-domain-containing protein [Ramicandelaber brevisporus]|nr:UPF0187-domain-containing protein [Ramicandelaber brevisporus]
MSLPTYDTEATLFFRWHSSVLPDVLPNIAFFTVYSAVITIINLVGKVNLQFKSSLITILSLVISMLLVFRTNTAYDRYYEGRRLWAQMVFGVRNLSRILFAGMPKAAIERRQMIARLLLAFVISVKGVLHHRNSLLDIEQNIPEIAHMLPAIYRHSQATNGTNPEEHTAIPSSILAFLSSFFATESAAGNIDAPHLTQSLAMLASLNDSLTSIERIISTPIPIAYAIQLNQIVMVYMLALPFQLVSDLKWVTIPVTAMAAFTFFGVESIGRSIECPFDADDDNDLPINSYTAMLAKEIDSYIENKVPAVESWTTDK